MFSVVPRDEDGAVGLQLRLSSSSLDSLVCKIFHFGFTIFKIRMLAVDLAT